MLAANLRDGLMRRRARGGWPEKAFHLRFAKPLLDQLPSTWAPIWRKGPPRWVQGGPNDPTGVSPIFSKVSFQGTATREGIRHLLPYRDRRLVRLTSRFPGRFGLHEGLTRPLARRLLLGRLPDSVRLRVTGMPFSPDYIPRMRRQAGEAMARLKRYEDSSVGCWIDLAWLKINLEWVGSGRTTDYGSLYEVQATVLTAEFLLWAATKSVDLSVGAARA
jgi:asparagine synthase (glutamine-hydrolysing)